MVLEDHRSHVVANFSSKEILQILREWGTLKPSDSRNGFLTKNSDISFVSAHRVVTACMKSFFA